MQLTWVAQKAITGPHNVGPIMMPLSALSLPAEKNQGFSRVKRVSKSRGSGRVMPPRDTGRFTGQAIMTRELFWADPRVKPADLAHESAFFKLTAESH